MFINSPNFTSHFLLELLNSYDEQAVYITKHYTDRGNHLLFEAQRVVTAGCFFPEMKDAESLRKNGVEILNREIAKQVYPDGMQFELSPIYHNAAIDIFLNALRATQLAGEANDFPASYKKTVENMIIASINFTFPDYTFPMFGDSWLTEKAAMLKLFRAWDEAFWLAHCPLTCRTPQHRQGFTLFAVDGKTTLRLWY
jgi:heparan-sulfate lyase